ncbi:MAG TPA: hypothetical protein VFI27_12955 [candidate division Zixibacteria bacterium]|nr:hypothetical protein [candidate division Zixibacteria bacterium]
MAEQALVKSSERAEHILAAIDAKPLATTSACLKLLTMATRRCVAFVVALPG